MVAQIQDVAGKSFDYVIAGGGTAALTLAARLTEDPNRTVLVLEAGGDNASDPFVYRPGAFGLVFGNDQYAWAHKTVPQKHLDGVELGLDRGKGLGGSSSINFFGWIKPPAEDINDFERLGNPGWNWERLNDAVRKIEGFVGEKEESKQKKVAPLQLGSEGPIKLSFPPEVNRIDTIFHESLSNAGIPPAPNPSGGDPKGYFTSPNSLDPKDYTRSYATTAFYAPNKDRPNFVVLLRAHVVRAILEPTADGSQYTATGIEFLHDGNKHIVHANKEVIVSAGTLKSPQILELSGVGAPDVLKKIDVPVKVELPGVGANLQDHILIGATFELKEDANIETMDIFSDPAEIGKHMGLYAQQKGLFVQSPVSYSLLPLETISSKASDILSAFKEDIQNKTESSSAGRRDQYNVQLNRLKYGRPGVEVLLFPKAITRPAPPVDGKKYLTIHVANYHAVSSGTVHATTSDPLQDPAFDPNYFEDDIDLQVLVEALHFARRLATVAPLKDVVASELNPGPLVAPGNDEQMKDYIKKYLVSTWHTSSTCSMLPREKGGVVDPNLKVYGTKNLRVVDLSIVPIHFASHTQAMVYGIAQVAADIIIASEKDSN